MTPSSPPETNLYFPGARTSEVTAFVCAVESF